MTDRTVGEGAELAYRAAIEWAVAEGMASTCVKCGRVGINGFTPPWRGADTLIDTTEYRCIDKATCHERQQGAQ